MCNVILWQINGQLAGKPWGGASSDARGLIARSWVDDELVPQLAYVLIPLFH